MNDNISRQAAIDAIKALKPCPFCGGEAREDTFEVVTKYRRRTVDAVICQCGGMAIGFDKSDAIKTWNRRAYDGG